MSTMQDVAKKAGVSKATVSRVLSGKGYVSEATRQQVFAAIEAAGYRPNLLARNLATNKSQCIGMVVTNTLYSGSYFSEILSQAAKKVEESGRQLILVDGKHSAQQEREAIEFLLDLRCDAIILYPRFLSISEMDEIIEQTRQPIVVVNRRLRKHPSHAVFCDHQQSACNATLALIERGHRHIAFITGALDSPTAQERLNGYKQAISRADIPVEPQRIIEGKWTPACGVRAIASLLERRVTFSAVIASNDDMAIGALKQLARAGIHVPQQVSLLGFDDHPIAPFLLPALSSVKDPVTEMIHEVINRIISMLDGGDMLPQKTLVSGLVLRESVADAPGTTR
ncbi:LacI family DNA-binding transcriptional regulator [Mixta tenebrionis]|uniref:LacI family transcriptional regulator n=1 Tax=Mixta tenebrionis TaxID=2562439 RepID=A0A506VCI7_9GAMM|nr:LacI family DNA-binding transcriptional regulator [Mixta tenebrionis]TPW43734.1 LacI family transcriptional regulator [Mixta tenebrionis]